MVKKKKKKKLVTVDSKLMELLSWFISCPSNFIDYFWEGD